MLVSSIVLCELEHLFVYVFMCLCVHVHAQKTIRNARSVYACLNFFYRIDKRCASSAIESMRWLKCQWQLKPFYFKSKIYFALYS